MKLSVVSLLTTITGALAYPPPPPAYLNSLPIPMATPVAATPTPISTPTPIGNTNDNNELGHAIVRNDCTHPIYMWSVGSTAGSQITIPPMHNYTEPFRHDPQTGGISLKVTAVEGGLYTAAPTMVFAYNLVGDQVWFDLSDIFGDPFKGFQVSLLPSEPEIRWGMGVPPAGSQVRRNEASKDLRLDIC